MESLDLIISSDTSIVNLAGALGRPVWILLSSNSDWRWLLDRTDSPWYPTARLFRQDKSGDWASAVDKVCAELAKTLAGQARKP
jgi:ADP-heptose:LPS heptosyltransferase